MRGTSENRTLRLNSTGGRKGSGGGGGEMAAGGTQE